MYCIIRYLDKLLACPFCLIIALSVFCSCVSLYWLYSSADSSVVKSFGQEITGTNSAFLRDFRLHKEREGDTHSISRTIAGPHRHSAAPLPLGSMLYVGQMCGCVEGAVLRLLIPPSAHSHIPVSRACSTSCPLTASNMGHYLLHQP